MNKKISDFIFSVGGRKFIIGLLAIFWLKGINTLCLWQSKLGEDNYVKLEDTMMWLLLGLFAANVAAKFTRSDKTGGTDEG
jgi:hypothetical protein